MPQVTRRGHVNSTVQTKIVIDPAQVQEAVDLEVTVQLELQAGRHVKEIRPQAVVSLTRGVTRAFIKTPWRWGPRSLNSILTLASLRG